MFCFRFYIITQKYLFPKMKNWLFKRVGLYRKNRFLWCMQLCTRNLIFFKIYFLYLSPLNNLRTIRAVLCVFGILIIPVILKIVSKILWSLTYPIHGMLNRCSNSCSKVIKLSFGKSASKTFQIKLFPFCFFWKFNFFIFILTKKLVL